MSTRVEFYTLGFGAFVGTEDLPRAPDAGTHVTVKPHDGSSAIQSKVRSRRPVPDDPKPYWEVELYLTSDEFARGDR